MELLFSETNKFSTSLLIVSWWPVFFLGIFLSILKNLDRKSKIASIVAIVLLTLLAIALLGARLRTSIYTDRIEYGWTFLGLGKKSIAKSEIKTIDVVEFNAGAGVGIRTSTTYGKIYNYKQGGYGIFVETYDAKKVLVQTADTLAAQTAILKFINDEN